MFAMRYLGRFLSEDDGCDVEDLCLDLIDGDWPGIVFEVILAIYSFVGIAVVADEHLATSLETLCRRLKLSEDVAGASFLALGSAAPEIIIAFVSTVKMILAGNETAEDRQASAFATSLAVSSILGSGMMAFTLIPGLCAMSVSRPMLLKRRPLARDAIVYAGSLALLYFVVLKGEAQFADASLMLILYAIYLTLTALAPAARECYRTRCLGKEASSTAMERGAAAELVEALAAEEAAEAAADDDDDDDDDGPTPWYGLPFVPIGAILRRTCPDVSEGSETEHLYPVTMVVAFSWLALFSTCLSAAITRWGTLLNLPGTAMGMFIVAVGAQIPDTVQAIAVAKRGMGSAAVASAVGSQVMNILIGLGMPWTMSTAAGIPIDIPHKPQLVMMTWLMVACVLVYLGVLLAPTVPTWGRFGRATLAPAQGWVLFGTYAAVAAIYLFWAFVIEQGEAD